MALVEQLGDDSWCHMALVSAIMHLYIYIVSAYFYFIFLFLFLFLFNLVLIN